MFGNILIATALSFAVGVSAVKTIEQNYNNDNIKNVVYDDEEYKITLSADELNNYTFENLYSDTHDEWNTNRPIIIFGDTPWSYDGYTDNYLEWCATYLGSLGYPAVKFNKNGDYKFTYEESNGVESLFETTITLYWGSGDITSKYNLYKSAIELDIQANSQIDIDEDIFSSLSSVFTNFIITLNTGVNSVIALFYDSANTQLTLLGTITTIVVGVAITYFLFRLVIGLIRLRG